MVTLAIFAPLAAAQPAPEAAQDSEPCISVLVARKEAALDPSAGWQHRERVCPDLAVAIDVSGQPDLYSTARGGAVHGAMGDPDAEVDTDAPCKECRAGIVLVRFEPDEGEPIVRQISPATLLGIAYFPARDNSNHAFRLVCRTTQPGHLSIGINDATPDDNALAEGKTIGLTWSPTSFDTSNDFDAASVLQCYESSASG